MWFGLVLAAEMCVGGEIVQMTTVCRKASDSLCQLKLADESLQNSTLHWSQVLFMIDSTGACIAGAGWPAPRSCCVSPPDFVYFMSEVARKVVCWSCCWRRGDPADNA
jgi:hypothetical protein